MKDIKITFKKAEKWSSRVWDVNPPKNIDGSYHFMHDKGSVGGLLKGFFGYRKALSIHKGFCIYRGFFT